MGKALSFVSSYLKARYLRQFKSRESLENYQQKKLRKHLDWVCKNSPFYAQLKGRPLEDFPIMDKSSMMANFDKLNTAGIRLQDAMDVAIASEQSRDFSPTVGDITVGLSSGTSGNRGIFLASPDERATWAGTIVGKVLPTSIFYPHRIALFLRANSNLYETINSKRMKFQFFDLIEPIESLTKKLDAFGPPLIVSPPSMLRMLAKAQREKKLAIAPMKIVSAAEVLDPIDEKYISQTFNQKIHQIYQCTEGLLGLSDRTGQLRINEDIVFVEKEWVNKEKTKFIPIITDMERSTQPIIRYRLNDILTIDQEAKVTENCFLPLEFIEGRADDLFYFKSKDPLTSPQEVFPDFIRRKIIMASDSIGEYRAVQTEIDKMEIYLANQSGNAIEGNEREKVAQSLENFFEEQNLEAPELEFKAHRPHFGLKKLKRIERQFEIRH